MTRGGDQKIALFIDDSVGLMDKELSMLATRSRHYNIKLLMISSQKFKGALDPILRVNITSLCVGSPFPNMKDLEAVADEFGDEFGFILFFEFVPSDGGLEGLELVKKQLDLLAARP